MSGFLIGDTRISDDAPAYLIAEIGHNHQGNLDLAKQLIRVAAQAGASAVKLQKRSNRDLFTAEAYAAPYSGPNVFGATYGEHREALEFDMAQYAELQAYADDLGIAFFATAFDAPSADFLARLGVPAIKMASGDIRSTPLLDYVASLGIPMIVSTGTADLADVERAVGTIYRHHDQFALLQCTAQYPVRDETLNLRVVADYRQRFRGQPVGLSYHSPFSAPALAAYCLGGRVFEVHVTLGRSMRGTDHAFSMEPDELGDLVAALAALERQLGSPVKRSLPEEAPARIKMGKSLIATRALPAGHVLTLADLALKSPGGHNEPHQLAQYVGLELSRPLAADDPLPTILGAIRQEVPA